MVAILVLIVAIYMYLTVLQATNLEVEEVSRFYMGAKGYVSDEVWYVDAARNILRKIFGLEPKQIGSTFNATLVYPSKDCAMRASNNAQAYGITVVSSAFSKLNAIYVSANSREAIENFGKATNATDIVYGWILGDAEGINNYLNLEHPPMAKYLIALSMLLLGDKPLYWRIPSIAMGMLIVVLTFFIVKKLIACKELAIIVATTVAVDPLIRNLASIALLDIFVAAFTLLTIFFAMNKRYKESLIVLGFASTFKFTALLTFLPVLFLYIGELIERGINKFTEILFKAIEFLLLAILSFIFFQLLVSIPIILKIGFGPWLQQSLWGAISWHLSIKCVGSGCPVASTPWDWFFGVNSFPLYIYPNGSTLYAQGFVPAYMTSFILMLFTLTYRFQKAKSMSKKPWVMFSSLFIAYVLLWIAGAKTQYSFYAVQLTPFIYIYLIIQIYEFLKRDNVIHVLISWKKLFELLWQALLTLLSY